MSSSSSSSSEAAAGFQGLDQLRRPRGSAPPLLPSEGASSSSAAASGLRYPSFARYLPDDYTAPQEQVLADVQRAYNKGQPLRLPAGYQQLPNITTPSRLYELPRYKTLKPLTADEEAEALKYSAATHLPRSDWLAEPRQLSDRATRKAEKEKRKKDKYDSLQKAFKDYAALDTAHSAYTRKHAIESQNERIRKWNEQWGTPEKYRALQHSLALKNIGRKLPASITNAKYLPYLTRDYVAGKDRSQLPDYLSSAITHPEWVGKAPQTLDPLERNRALMAFGELLGVLHVVPVFDPRLTSPASAATVFNTKDYTIETYDLDDNVLTPGTVIITTNFDTKDFNDNPIPKGQIVAIGGYKIANPSSGRSMADLQRMVYFQDKPSKRERQDVPFTDWKLTQDAFTKSKSKPRGMRLIADLIREMLERAGFSLPTRAKIGDKYREMPAFMRLMNTNDNGIYAYYKVSSIVMNTIVSRSAELLFNLFIAPRMYQQLKATNAGVTNRTVRDFILGCDEPIEFSVSTADGVVGTQTLALTEPLDVLDQRWGYGLPLALMFCWRASYFHPKALGAILAEKVIKTALENAVKDFTQDPGIFLIMGWIVNVVMTYTMNSNIEAYLDDIVGGPVTNENLKQAMVLFVSNAMFDFCKDDEVDAIVASLSTERPANVIVLSSRAWDKDVRMIYKLSERCKSRLHATYQGLYNPNEIPVFSDAGLYTSGRGVIQARRGKPESAAVWQDYALPELAFEPPSAPTTEQIAALNQQLIQGDVPSTPKAEDVPPFGDGGASSSSSS